jgi:hypothetical protein
MPKYITEAITRCKTPQAISSLFLMQSRVVHISKKHAFPLLIGWRTFGTMASMRFPPFITLALAGFLSVPCAAFDPADQDDSQAIVREFSRPVAPVGPPFQEGKFLPLQGETISLLGGTMVFQMQDHGYLEAALQLSFPDKQIRVRNLGWPGDTVYLQQRPMFYYTEKGDPREGSVPDQREKVEPGTFILTFGKVESLDGAAALPEFEKTYDALLTELGKLSKRIVIVEPVPFANAGPAASLAEKRNEVLEHYSAGIRSLAANHGALFVKMGSFPESAFARNGLDLTSSGQEEFAARFAQSLGLKPSSNSELVSAILTKDNLWEQYHRPTNWAFLFGDRQSVPSSRDHRDANRRWFVEEISKFPVLLELADETIHQTAQSASQ